MSYNRKGHTTVASLNESLSLPSFFFFFSSLLRLLPRSSPSLAWSLSQVIAKTGKPVSGAVSPRRWPPAVLPARRDPAHAPRAPCTPGSRQDARVTLEPGAASHQPPPEMLLGWSTNTANRTAAQPAVSQRGLVVSYIFFLFLL